MLHGSGQMPPIGNIGVMASGLFAFLVYTMGMLLCHTTLIAVHSDLNAAFNGKFLSAGSGFGNARNQSRGLLFLYSIISAINAALVSRRRRFVQLCTALFCFMQTP